MTLNKRKIFTIGCGRWGTCIAWYLDSIGHDVTLYGREGSKNLQQLRNTRKNEYMEIPETMKLTSDLTGIMDADYVIVSIGAQNLQDLMDQLAALNVRNKTFVLCMKGIEIDTGRRLSEIASGTLDRSNHAAVWLGPGHVQEFYRGVPNCMVIDSAEPEVKKQVIEEFSSDLIRFYYGTDLIGNEVGAAAKNVIGIAAGMLDGVDRSSLKGALMARGTAEIGRLIDAMGGKRATVYGLCHLGDYEATLFSEHSHNRTFGMHFVRGESYDKLAEGCYTVKALVNLGKRYEVELPICEAVFEILYNDGRPETVLRGLFSRDLKKEFV